MNISPGFDIAEHCDKLAKSGTEHAHQRAFFQWLNFVQLTGEHPMARMAFAIPNGGKRDQITAGRLKAEGVKPGVPDVCYPLPRWAGSLARVEFLSLWLEFKKPDEGTPSAVQDEWRIDLRVCGHAVANVWSWRLARQAFLDYVGGQPVLENYK